MGKSSLLLKIGGLVIGLALVTSAVVSTIIKNANYGGKFQIPDTATEIYNENCSVSLINNSGKKVYENLRIKAAFDKKNNTLYFGNYTENYNRENWTGTEKNKLPIPYRHTKLNSEWSEVYIIYPRELKIKTIKQKAHLVPQYKWDNLRPFEKHEEAQQLIEGGENILSWAQGKVPFSKQILTRIIEHGETNKQKYESELLDKINKNYIIERISPYVPTKLVGFTETAREYKISFDYKELNKEIPIYIFTRIVLGDAGHSTAESFSNKYGKTGLIDFKFNLIGGKQRLNNLNENVGKISKEYLGSFILYGDRGSKKYPSYVYSKEYSSNAFELSFRLERVVEQPGNFDRPWAEAFIYWKILNGNIKSNWWQSLMKESIFFSYVPSHRGQVVAYNNKLSSSYINNLGYLYKGEEKEIKIIIEPLDKNNSVIYYLIDNEKYEVTIPIILENFKLGFTCHQPTHHFKDVNLKVYNK